LLAEADELFIKRACLGKEELRSASQVNGNDFIRKLFTDDLAPKYRFLLPKGSTGRLYEASLNQDESFIESDNISYVFDGPPICTFTHSKTDLPKKRLAKGLLLKEEYLVPKAFLLVVGKGKDQKVYGFTSLHLAYWHWLEQLKKGEQLIGADARPYPVTIDLAEWGKT